MVKYTRFLLSTIMQKKAPYIISVLFFILFGGTEWLQISQVNDLGLTGISSVNTFSIFFPFLFSVLFMSMIIIYVFKQGESDGSELMVVAKPLSRRQIIMGKFITLYIYLGIWTFITFFAYFIIGLLDSVASTSEAFKFGLSLSVGGAIVLVIITSILVIAAAKLGRTGLLSLGIVASAIIPIISYILSPIGGGQSFAYTFNNDEARIVNKEVDLSNPGVESISSLSPESIYVGSETDDFNNYVEKTWYKNVAPADLWYQWGRFYSIFIGRQLGRTNIAKWQASTKVINKNQTSIATKNDGEFVPLANIKSFNYFSSRFDLTGMISKITNAMKNPKNPQTPIWDASISLHDRISALSKLIKDIENEAVTLTLPTIVADKDLNQTSKEFALAIILYPSLTKNFPQPDNVIDPSVGTLSFDKGNGNLTLNNKPVYFGYMAKDGQKIKVYLAEDYIPTKTVLYVWITLAGVLLAVATALFMRRDFK